MAIVTKETLKSYFNDGDVPIESNYVDLIDTMGDMSVATYDTNSDGRVDAADHATNATTAATATNSDTVDFKHATEFAPSGFGLGTTATDVSNGNWNNYVLSGFYRGTNMTNAPNASGAWYYVWVLGHSSAYCTQFAVYYYSQLVYMRVMNNTTWTAWQPVYPAEWAAITGKPSTFTPSSHTHGGGDITSQVSDADKVDNFHAASFVRADADDTKTGDLRMTGGLVVGSDGNQSADGEITALASYRSYRGSTNYIMHMPRILSSPIRLASGKFNATVGQSTVSKTFVDMSVELSGDGVPTAYITAYIFKIATRDSGSGGTGDPFVVIGSNTTLNDGTWFGCAGLTNDKFSRQTGVVPANSNGDVYYNVSATGSGTLDMVWDVVGYYID